MKNSDKRAFAQALIATGEVYDKEITQAKADIYFIDMTEFTVEQVIQAMAAHRRDPDRGRFFPKPADLIAKIEGEVHGQALSAWPEVERLAANSSEAISQNPITEIVVREMGGWQRFGRAEYREYPFLQREFVERYETYRQTPKLLEQAKQAQLGVRSNKTLQIGEVGHG